MTALAGLAVIVALAGQPSDTARISPDDSSRVLVPGALVMAVSAPDTLRPRTRAVEVSDWYERRLRIHRYGAYAMYPLFAMQAVVGNQIFQDPHNSSELSQNTHRTVATALAGVFTVNTVTGLWNLYDSRSVSQGRARRYTHALLMLASDAGFTYAGARLSEQAETSVEKRREHRTWAYGSMAVALSGVAIMKFWPGER